MVTSFPERHRGALLLAACLLCLQPAWVAKAEPRIDTETQLEIEGSDPQSNLNTGTLRMRDVVITQGPTTTIRAADAKARGLRTEGGSTWDLSGGVHIEFSSLVLDADSATVVFANHKIATVHVQGKPARFSHRQKDAAKRDGRATTITYDARTSNLRLAGGTWLSDDGGREIQSPVLLYNLNEGSVSNDSKAADSGRARIIIPGKLPTIPTPRTPDRDTAK